MIQSTGCSTGRRKRSTSPEFPQIRVQHTGDPYFGDRQDGDRQDDDRQDDDRGADEGHKLTQPESTGVRQSVSGDWPFTNHNPLGHMLPPAQRDCDDRAVVDQRRRSRRGQVRARAHDSGLWTSTRTQSKPDSEG